MMFRPFQQVPGPGEVLRSDLAIDLGQIARFGLLGQFAVPVCRLSIALGLAQPIFTHSPHPNPEGWRPNGVIRGGPEDGAGACWGRQCDTVGPNSKGLQSWGLLEGGREVETDPNG